MTKGTTFFRVDYAAFRTTARPSVIVTVRDSAGREGMFYATAPGAGCSKDYASRETAARELVGADLGTVLSVERVAVWRACPELMERLNAAQNALRAPVDIVTFAGMCETREELEAHVRRYEDQNEEDAARAANPEPTEKPLKRSSIGRRQSSAPVWVATYRDASRRLIERRFQAWTETEARAFIGWDIITLTQEGAAEAAKAQTAENEAEISAKLAAAAVKPATGGKADEQRAATFQAYAADRLERMLQQLAEHGPSKEDAIKAAWLDDTLEMAWRLGLISIKPAHLDDEAGR
jgi:hypothetical protein